MDGSECQGPVGTRGLGVSRLMGSAFVHHVGIYGKESGFFEVRDGKMERGRRLVHEGAMYDVKCACSSGVKCKNRLADPLRSIDTYYTEILLSSESSAGPAQNLRVLFVTM